MAGLHHGNLACLTWFECTCSSCWRMFVWGFSPVIVMLHLPPFIPDHGCSWAVICALWGPWLSPASSPLVVAVVHGDCWCSHRLVDLHNNKQQTTIWSTSLLHVGARSIHHPPVYILCVFLFVCFLLSVSLRGSFEVSDIFPSQGFMRLFSFLM